MPPTNTDDRTFINTWKTAVDSSITAFLRVISIAANFNCLFPPHLNLKSLRTSGLTGAHLSPNLGFSHLGLQPFIQRRQLTSKGRYYPSLNSVCPSEPRHLTFTFKWALLCQHEASYLCMHFDIGHSNLCVDEWFDEWAIAPSTSLNSFTNTSDVYSMLTDLCSCPAWLQEVDATPVFKFPYLQTRFDWNFNQFKFLYTTGESLDLESNSIQIRFGAAIGFKYLSPHPSPIQVIQVNADSP
ncbi:hypothetical protein C8F04DRAFT_1198938 [Mycena alexandri]|uniref:Uncharacterized protein n=1 Tax=Mycena alexandri TaxID=1745969 RepID=A0AAD6S1C5_9AGAR|nr:hypothetical protein C8F04DRAFT_1198938 [Mycena alexandri]